MTECFGFDCKGRDSARATVPKSEALIEHCPACVGDSHRTDVNPETFELAVTLWLAGFVTIAELSTGGKEVDAARCVNETEARVDGLGVTKQVRREAARVAGWRRRREGLSDRSLIIPSSAFEKVA